MNDSPVAKLSGRLFGGAGVQLARMRGVWDRTSESRVPAHLLILGADRVEHSGRLDRRAVVALPASTAHRTASRGATRLVVYLDARRYRFGQVQQLADLWAGVDPETASLEALFDDALRVPRPRFHPRLATLFDVLEQDGSVREAAARVGLSTGWVSQLVLEETGSSPRCWRRWLRLRRGVEALAAGQAASRSAHASGFSDAAHMTRTTRRLLGTTPSRLASARMELRSDVW